jgi:K+-transporting ATPase c subunit
MDDPTTDLQVARPVGSLRLALGVAVVLTVVIGFYPAITTFVGEASRIIATGG